MSCSRVFALISMTESSLLLMQCWQEAPAHPTWISRLVHTDFSRTCWCYYEKLAAFTVVYLTNNCFAACKCSFLQTGAPCLSSLLGNCLLFILSHVTGNKCLSASCSLSCFLNDLWGFSDNHENEKCSVTDSNWLLCDFMSMWTHFSVKREHFLCLNIRWDFCQ